MSNTVCRRRHTSHTSTNDCNSLAGDIFILGRWRRGNRREDPGEHGLEGHVEPGKGFNKRMPNEGRQGRQDRVICHCDVELEEYRAKLNLWTKREIFVADGLLHVKHVMTSSRLNLDCAGHNLAKYKCTSLYSELPLVGPF